MSIDDVVPFRNDITPEEIQRYDAFWQDKIDATKLGPFAEDPIPAKGKEQKFTAEERKAINEIGYKTGCHTCGSKDPGSRSGDFVPDHQPISALVPNGTPQRLYPQCRKCSSVQSGMVSAKIQK